MTQKTTDHPVMGVVVVTYCASDVIATCLETLLGAQDVALRIVVVDNGSPDDTLAVIRDWARGVTPFAASLPFDVTPAPKPVPLDGSGAGHHVTLIATGQNMGFAGGVNVGLAHLAQDAAIDRFWVLNPDCAVPPATAAIFANAPDGFSLMGGRIVFQDTPDQIQIDGGVIRWGTGLTKNLNHTRNPAKTPWPDSTALDFISGASMVASRAFYESVGPLHEDYFLYYEEVDWAQRRNLPLAYAQGAVVYHKGGSEIGSRRGAQKASALSLYFIHRARMRFLWRFRRTGLPGAVAYSFAKAGQLALTGDTAGAVALLRGTFQLRAPAAVRRILG